MTFRVMSAALLAVLAVAGAARAAEAPGAAPAPVAAPSPPAAADARAPEPRVEHLVTEDGAVRIEEDRVRSQTTRIVVKSKVPGLGSYEIAPADLSKDPATDTKGGKRIWFSLPF